MKKENIRKVEAIEIRCINTGNGPLFHKAVACAKEEGLKEGTKPFAGMVRRLVEWQEAGMLILG